MSIKQSVKQSIKQSVILLSAVLAASVVMADTTDDLIALDKQWGEASGPAGFVSEDVVAIGPAGIVGFSEMVAEAAAAGDMEEAYTVSGYRVEFLSDDIAVMVHAAAGSDPHSSLHVFQKQNNAWLVVATASSPIGE